MWHDEIRRLAESALNELIAVTSARAAFAAMRSRARQSAQRFGAEAAKPFWDAFYERAVDGVVPASPLA
jgi:hypothetical protein